MVKDNEIRLDIGQGIAGKVALTGKKLNIPNAYEVYYRYLTSHTEAIQATPVGLLPTYSKSSILALFRIPDLTKRLTRRQDIALQVFFACL